MKFIICLAFSVIASISYAAEIVTDTQQIESLQKSLRENPYYRKIGPFKYEIFYFEIGKPITPFYVENSQVKRFYKNEEKCFELMVMQKKNIAHKIRCSDKAKTLYLKGFEEFKVVEKTELVKEGLNSFLTNEFAETYKLLANLQSYDMYLMDYEIYGAEMEKLSPKKEFNVHLKGLTEVKLNEKEFQITQKLSLAVDNIGWLTGKSDKVSNTIKKENGGLIFSNGQGKVLIYNPYLRAPFGTHQLKLNKNLPLYLNKLAYDSQNAPVCFRDSYTSSNYLGCHEMIFKKHSLGVFETLKIVEIDFVRKEIRFR
jgi:hypothetical protein